MYLQDVTAPRKYSVICVDDKKVAFGVHFTNAKSTWYAHAKPSYPSSCNSENWEKRDYINPKYCTHSPSPPEVSTRFPSNR